MFYPGDPTVFATIEITENYRFDSLTEPLGLKVCARALRKKNPNFKNPTLF
jgi:hypothetical protein